MSVLIQGILGFVFGGKVLDWLTPDIPSPTDPGVELNGASTDSYIPKIYGKVTEHSGLIVYKATNEGADEETPNELAHYIIVWGEGISGSIDKVYADGIDLESNSELFVNEDGRFAHVVNFPNGMDGYEDPFLNDSGWRSTDSLSNKACSYIRLQYASGENLLRSEPRFTADITGTNIENPATLLSDYLRNGVYGKGLDNTLIDFPSFTESASTCDTLVMSGGGTLRPLFTANTALDTSNTIFQNVNTLLRPMRAMMPISDGKLKLIIEKDDPPVDVPILDADILQLGF